MPGFKRCHWCSGKGCIACDAERAKWEANEKKRAEEEAKQDPRIRLRNLKSSIARQIAEQLGPDAVAALEAEIADAQAACDAEYERLFPNGPTPIFIARAGNAKDMELARGFIGTDALSEAFGPEGDGMASVLAKAEKARSEQSPPVDYKPIGR